MSIEVRSKNHFRAPALTIILMAVSLLVIPAVFLLAVTG